MATTHHRFVAFAPWILIIVNDAVLVLLNEPTFQQVSAYHHSSLLPDGNLLHLDLTER